MPNYFNKTLHTKCGPLTYGKQMSFMPSSTCNLIRITCNLTKTKTPPNSHDLGFQSKIGFSHMILSFNKIPLHILPKLRVQILNLKYFINNFNISYECANPYVWMTLLDHPHKCSWYEETNYHSCRKWYLKKLCCHKYGHHLRFEGGKVENLSFAKLYANKTCKRWVKN